MTLYRQLIVAILLLFLGSYIGTLMLNVYTTRTFLEHQLTSHAQDTATSLGLSLSPHMEKNDLITMTAIVNSIFDRGYYREIRVTDMQGKILIGKSIPVVFAGVPAWLVHWLPLETPQETALVMSGWRQSGTIFVRSHPGYAYAELWSITRTMLVWFSLLMALTMVVAIIGLRHLLKPLAAVEHQAQAIAARRYEIQSTLPRTRELRRVVMAMNQMSEKVKSMFDMQTSNADSLRQLAYADPVTGLGNRRYFEAQVVSAIDAQTPPRGMALMLIRLDGLQALNDTRGLAAGDALLRAAGAILLETVPASKDAVWGRLTGADFGLFLANVTNAGLNERAVQISDRLGALYAQGLSTAPGVSHIGAAIHAPGEDIRTLLARADTALRQAQAAGPNAWRSHESVQTSSNIAFGRQDGKRLLEEAIRTQHFVLHAQGVADSRVPKRTLHHEVFVRLLAPSGVVFSAETIMPLAEELGMAREIDFIVLSKLSGYLVGRGPGAPFALNVSSGALRDRAFFARAAPLLATLSAHHHSIIFEVSEFSATRDAASLHQFTENVRASGHQIAVDHFGSSFASFGYLQSMQPYYAKLDGAFTQNLAVDMDTRFYVKSLCSVAHALDIPVIAVHVESEEHQRLLESLGVDGVQGYGVGKTVALEDLVVGH